MAYHVYSLPDKMTKGGVETPTNFNGGEEAMDAAYEAGNVAAMLGGGVLVAAGDEADDDKAEGGSGTTTVVDVARMKADATSAATKQVAQEAPPLPTELTDAATGASYQIDAFPDHTYSSPATTPLETEATYGIPTDTEVGGAAYHVYALPERTTEGETVINLDAGEAMDAADEASDLKAVFELNRVMGVGSKILTGAATVGGVVAGQARNGVVRYSFPDAEEGGGGVTTTTTVVEATSIATKVAKEADDVIVAGNKLL